MASKTAHHADEASLGAAMKDLLIEMTGEDEGSRAVNRCTGNSEGEVRCNRELRPGITQE